jgi:hypothetical protein
MKTTFVTLTILLVSSAIYSQNKNVKDETKTTTTTVKTIEGDKTFVKTENVKEVQIVELKGEKPNTLNIETKDSPVTVTTTTKITNPDGTTRTVDIDRSSYYESNGNKYKMSLDASGYTMTLGNSKPALLRKTSTNSYIYRLKNKIAIGYFDTDGNLILETYDDKSDRVTTEKYVVVRP